MASETLCSCDGSDGDSPSAYASAHDSSDATAGSAMSLQRMIPDSQSAWSPVDALYRFPSTSSLERVSDASLPAAWRMIIASDASLTRTLAIVSRSPTSVKLLGVHRGAQLSGAGELAPPPQLELIPGPHVHRRVLLRNARGEVFAYASSWWCSASYDVWMADEAAPIGANLATARLDVFRDFQGWYLGECAWAAALLSVEPHARLWSRMYVMYHAHTPLCIITEVFSNALCKYLGPYATEL